MPAYCKRCRLHIPDGMSSCRMCGSAVLSAPPPLTDDPLLPTPSIGAARSPVSKWLFVIALGLIVAPLAQIYAIVELDVPALFTERGSALLAQNPGLDNVVYFEMGMNALLVLAALVINFLFYTRSRHFPASMVAYVAVTFVSRLADVGMMHFLFPHLHANEFRTAYSLARYFLWGAALAVSLFDSDVRTRFHR